MVQHATREIELATDRLTHSALQSVGMPLARGIKFSLLVGTGRDGWRFYY